MSSVTSQHRAVCVRSPQSGRNTLSEEVKRRFYKNWYRSKKKAFDRYAAKLAEDAGLMSASLERIKKYASVIRVLAHTQIKLLKLRQKKAHLVEIQVNGGADVSEKLSWAQALFEKSVSVDTVFKQDEMIDVSRRNSRSRLQRRHQPLGRLSSSAQDASRFT